MTSSGARGVSQPWWCSFWRAFYKDYGAGFRFPVAFLVPPRALLTFSHRKNLSYQLEMCGIDCYDLGCYLGFCNDGIGCVILDVSFDCAMNLSYCFLFIYTSHMGHFKIDNSNCQQLAYLCHVQSYNTSWIQFWRMILFTHQRRKCDGENAPYFSRPESCLPSNMKQTSTRNS